MANTRKKSLKKPKSKCKCKNKELCKCKKKESKRVVIDKFKISINI